MGQGERRSVGFGGWYEPFWGWGRKGVVSVGGVGWDIVGLCGRGVGWDVFVMMFFGGNGVLCSDCWFRRVRGFGWGSPSAPSYVGEAVQLGKE